MDYGCVVRVKVKADELVIGQPLDWDLYNESGTCIFRKGFVVHSHESLKRIMSIPLFYEAEQDSSTPVQQKTRLDNIPATTSAPKRSTPSPVLSTSTSTNADEQIPLAPRRRKVTYAFNVPKVEIKELADGNIFVFLDYCIAQEKWICDLITSKQQVDLKHIASLATNLQNLLKQAPDACLGAIHVEYQHPHSCCQPIYSALLCLLVAQGLGLNNSNQNSLLLAALTANLGMYDYQDRLVNMTTALTTEETAVVKSHPGISHQMLLDNGVTDSLWLDIVLQHHERRDGSGYPKGLGDSDILPEAKILAIVDSYLTMIMPRAYRKPLAPKHALQKIYQTAVADEDSLSLGLIKQLGIYPPGSLVRLASHELAVVVALNKTNSLAPQVACIGFINGRLYPEPIFRNTVTDVYKIVDAYLSEEAVEIDINQLWQHKLEFDFLAVD